VATQNEVTHSRG